MTKTRFAKLAAMTTLFAAGLFVGTMTPDAEARPAGKCSYGFTSHSGSSIGYVCSSQALVCGKGHEVFQAVYNNGKKRFDYKCTKSSNVPK